MPLRNADSVQMASVQVVVSWLWSTAVRRVRLTRCIAMVAELDWSRRSLLALETRMLALTMSTVAETRTPSTTIVTRSSVRVTPSSRATDAAQQRSSEDLEHQTVPFNVATTGPLEVTSTGMVTVWPLICAERVQAPYGRERVESPLPSLVPSTRTLSPAGQLPLPA